MEIERKTSKRAKLNASARLFLTITATIIVVSIFLLSVVIPVAYANYEKDIYKTLKGFYGFSKDIEDYKNSTVVGLLTKMADAPALYSEEMTPVEKPLKSTIVSYDTLWEIYERLVDAELEANTTHTIKFTAEDTTVVYMFCGKNEVGDLFAIYTTAKAFGFNTLYTKIVNAFLIGIAVTIVACVSFGIIIYKNSKEIQRVNDFLSNYSNDYTLPASASKEIMQLVDNFKNYRRSLLQKDIEKQQLFQNISHELKTPITTIKMYAEGMQDGIYKNDDISQSAGVIIDETNELLTKVSKIMQINKISYLEATKKNTINSEIVNLSEVLFNVMNTYSDRAPNVMFNCKLEKIEFRGTVEVWRTIFENIFDNNIRHGAKEINITLDNEYMIIENNGEHIDPKVSETIYEPFKKGNKGNYGLGVSIILRSLQLYDYTLKISNSENGVVYFVSDNKSIGANKRA